MQRTQSQKLGHEARDKSKQSNVRALVLSSGELKRLQSDSNWLKRQFEDGVQRQIQIEAVKNTSQKIVNKWNNTVLNKQKERLQRRLERIQRDEDRKNATYRASLQEATEKRKKIIDDARRLILYDRDDIHQVNSAFVFSEVLRERGKQVEFNKYLKDKECSEKAAMAEKIKFDTQVHKEQEMDRLAREHEAKMKRKALNIKIMKEKAENEAMLLSSEKEHEKQDLADIEAEMKQVKENIEREIQRKKEHVRRDALESIALKMEKENLQKQEEEEEEKVIQIYCGVKQRMECLRQKKEVEAHHNKLEQQDRIRSIIAQSLKEKEDDLDSMIAKALQEREDREAEKLKKQKEYEAKLLKERQDYMIEVQSQKVKDEREEKERKNWIIMQRLKRDEVDKITCLRNKETAWSKKMDIRLGYNIQLEQMKDKKAKEFQEEQQQYDYICKRNQCEDGDFFSYAQEVTEECKSTGRPLYPIQKAIQDYRKRHGLIQREKYDAWVKENCALQQWTSEGGFHSQELEVSNQVPLLEMKSYQPLMKAKTVNL